MALPFSSATESYAGKGAVSFPSAREATHRGLQEQLQGCSHTFRPEDFANQPFVALGPTTPSRHLIDDVFSRHGVSRVLRVETPLSEIACALVASGLGLSICDPFTANEYSTRGVVSRPFEPALAFQVSALYPSHRALSPVAREFISGFAAYIESFGW